MKIEGKVKKNVLHIKVDGRIDLDTSTELEAYLKDNIEGVGSVEIDFKKCRIYLFRRSQSSAVAQKAERGKRGLCRRKTYE